MVDQKILVRSFLNIQGDKKLKIILALGFLAVVSLTMFAWPLNALFLPEYRGKNSLRMEKELTHVGKSPCSSLSTNEEIFLPGPPLALKTSTMDEQRFFANDYANWHQASRDHIKKHSQRKDFSPKACL